MLQEKPGAYIWLGAGEAQPGKMLHNTGYDFNDEILPVGTSYWPGLWKASWPKTKAHNKPSGQSLACAQLV